MIDFEATITDRSLKVYVTAEAHIYRENYGADADGNRGEMQTFLDDLEITILDGRGNDITEKVEKKYKYDYEKIQIAAEDKLLEEWEG
jgi:uncharacterized protein YnzC (UPF0291/DUF896 family)